MPIEHFQWACSNFDFGLFVDLSKKLTDYIKH